MDAFYFVKHGFPQIYPLNSLVTCVEGYITVLNEDFFIHLHVLDDKHPKKVNVKGTWKLQQLLQPKMPILKQHLSLCSSIVDMLNEVKAVAEQQMKSRVISVSDNLSFEYYKKIVSQLHEISQSRISYVGPNFRSIKLKAYDECSREHILQINIPSAFPNESPTYSCDLPEDFTLMWSPTKTLLDVYNHFEESLSKYYDFWRYMIEIDENTWILGPENRTPATCKRRIALAPTSSLLIIVNPSCPSAAPACEFLGPDEVVGPLRERFSENVDQWDDGLSLLSNLRNVFDMEFPSPLTSTKEEFCIDCGICYAHQLEDAIPDVICNNSKCSKPFHQMCLYEWLRVFPSARHTLNKILGDCPCCGDLIGCPIQNQ